MLYLNFIIKSNSNQIFHLTLTNVVFELKIDLCNTSWYLHLTLTNVVFEYSYESLQI